MSGPNAPPMNQMLARNAGAAMRQFPGGLATDTANYGRASSVPRPNAPPVRTPQTPAQAPAPAPAPAQIPLPVSDPRKAQLTDPNQPNAIDSAQWPQGPVGAPPVVAQGSNFTPPSNADALRTALEAKARSMAAAQPPRVTWGWGGPAVGGGPAPATPQAPAQAPVPAPTLPQVTTKDIAEKMVPKAQDRPPTDPTQPQAPAPEPAPTNPNAMRFSYQQPKPGDAGSGDFPRAVPKTWYTKLTKGEVPVRATIPNAIMDRAIRAAKEGSKFSVPQLSEKTQTNQETKGGNLWFYKTLGVTPGDKTGAAHAITRLQQKQLTAPWEITPQEDRILASATKSEGFHQSLEPKAIAGRILEAKKAGQAAGYGEVPPQGETTMQFQRPSFDPAQTKVEQFIANAGTPPMQGKPGAPTQQDVNSGYKPPAPAQAPEEEGPPEEED